MTDKRISIEDLFARQIEPAPLLVTIEPVDGDDTKLAVTPYSAEAGCSCGSTIKLNKDLVDWVIPTDQSHNCCGKRLIVVEIGFKDATLADVFSQLAEHGRTNAIARKVSASMALRKSPAQLRGLPGALGVIGAGGIQDPDQLANGWFDNFICGLRYAADIHSCKQLIVAPGGAYDKCICQANYSYNVCVNGPEAAGPSPC